MLLTDSFPWSHLKLYLLIFPIYKQNHQYPPLDTTSSSKSRLLFPPEFHENYLWLFNSLSGFQPHKSGFCFHHHPTCPQSIGPNHFKALLYTTTATTLTYIIIICLNNGNTFLIDLSVCSFLTAVHSLLQQSDLLKIYIYKVCFRHCFFRNLPFNSYSIINKQAYTMWKVLCKTWWEGYKYKIVQTLQKFTIYYIAWPNT